MKLKLTVVLLLYINFAFAQVAARYDVLITEIMADPTPTVSLPNAEYLELKNISAFPLNLNGWKIADANGTATIAVNFILQPDSQVIICSSGSVILLGPSVTALGISNFPSLDNEGDLLSLRSKDGSLMHAVEYNKNWYQSALKSEGGWSLEMVDTKTPCAGINNWKASTDARGGTPGRKNAAAGMYKDEDPPLLQYVFATDSITLVAVLDEPLDSLKAAAPNNYTINDGIGNPVQALPLGPLFNRVQLSFARALQQNKVYQLTVGNIRDCAGNLISAGNTAKVGLAALPGSQDLVINEILFHPLPDGNDYVEVFNRASKIIDLKDCYITNRAANGTIGQWRQLSVTPRLLFPGEFITVTENPLLVQKQYLTKNPNAFLPLSALPSFPNEKGTVVLLNQAGNVLDELTYNENWHFKLLNNIEGVALERIHYDKPTQEAGNWHSASTSAGYGTPGYQNSQYMANEQLAGAVNISPTVFSPDNDGRDDVATLSYQFNEQGYVCNTTIYDANGRVVRYLIRNAVCGQAGYFRWDGLGEKNQLLPIGMYIIYTEVFNLKGKTRKFKQVITLARRF
jgi:hypothetical protein